MRIVGIQGSWERERLGLEGSCLRSSLSSLCALAVLHLSSNSQTREVMTKKANCGGWRCHEREVRGFKKGRI